MRTTLLILSFCFIVYSLVVYAFGDSKEAQHPSAEVMKGWSLWQEKNCQSCHQIYGLGGYMGPDLTNTASQKGVAYMRGFIQYGTGRMPNFHLEEEETASLIAFLSWVDQSGSARVPDAAVHWTGTYIISKR